MSGQATVQVNSTVYAKPSLHRAVEFLAAERSLIMTNVYHHLALLHIVASKVGKNQKEFGKLRGFSQG